jgi:hypothetical protein
LKAVFATTTTLGVPVALVRRGRQTLKDFAYGPREPQVRND